MNKSEGAGRHFCICGWNDGVQGGTRIVNSNRSQGKGVKIVSKYTKP